MSIPVIGTAVVNSTKWVSRLVKSIDYPVDNFVIFNNNGMGELTEDLDKLKDEPHEYVKKITVCHLPANIGVAGAWNMIIKCYMNSQYWIIVNDDIAFCEGFLEEMVTAAAEDDIAMVHGSGGDFNDGSWDLFLIKDWVIAEYGLFDENLYPAYCEDVDYIMRLALKPVRVIPNLTKSYYHGEGLSDEYYTHGSQTRKTDPSLNDKLNDSNEINFEYLNKKWGKGWRCTNPQKDPMGVKGIPLSYTSYDLRFVRKKHLGF